MKNSLDNRVESKRIVRKCPRCRRRLHHWATLFRDQWMTWVVASCTDCGHQWQPRLIKAEWDEFPEGQTERTI